MLHGIISVNPKKKDEESATKKLREDGKTDSTNNLLSKSLHVDEFSKYYSLFTLGFIVKIMEKYFLSDKSKSSLQFLTELDSFQFESMTYPDAKEKIRELCKEHNVLYTPIIFIDETTLAKKMKPNDKTLEKFLFLRTVLRLIHVIPVFMGTNFNPVNFLLSNNNTDSRSEDKFYRTYVIYKLPPVPTKIGKMEKRESLRIVSQKDIENANNAEIILKIKNTAENIKTIYEFLEEERPLFFYDFVKALNEYLEKNEFPFKFNELFNSLIKNLFWRFRDRKLKKDCNWEFNYAQFCYLASKNRETNRNRAIYNTNSEDDDIPFFSDLRYIHRHTGFLVGPANCEEFTNTYDKEVVELLNEEAQAIEQLTNEMPPETTASMTEIKGYIENLIIEEDADKNAAEVTSEKDKDARSTFFKLFSSAKKNQQVNRYQYFDNEGIIRNYKPYTIFPSIRKYCLSGLAFAALKEGRHLIFTDEYEDSKRISTLNTLYHISLNLGPGNSINKEIYQFEPAEALVHTATVIASHVDGFETVTIETFLQAFIHELHFGAKYDDDKLLPSINYDDLKDLETRVKEKFPYLAPVDQQWNTKFVEFMKSIFPNFQYGTANYPRVGNDMFINKDNSREYSATTFMCIEVKCHEVPIGEKSIESLANTLLGNHGDFFLLVVRKGGENESKKNAKIPDADRKEGSIFLLQKVEQEQGPGQKNLNFYFKCIWRDTKSRRIVFAMDLGTINYDDDIDLILAPITKL